MRNVWTQLFPSGAAPAARFGHVAALDADPAWRLHDVLWAAPPQLEVERHYNHRRVYFGAMELNDWNTLGGRRGGLPAYLPGC